MKSSHLSNLNDHKLVRKIDHDVRSAAPSPRQSLSLSINVNKDTCVHRRAKVLWHSARPRKLVITTYLALVSGLNLLAMVKAV